MQSALLDPVSVLKDLIACPSVTPEEAGALGVLERYLTGLGFSVERLTFSEAGTPDVENLWATIGSGVPHLVFVGHTDVVPPGDAALWSQDPFGAETVDGVLYGRGAADMKGGIAAFAAAASGIVEKMSDGTLSFLITGDEEGPSINGTVKLLHTLLERGIRFDAALVGEPTCVSRLGDTIKIGRRGSLSGIVVVRGTQGHAAYPHLADNPIPLLTRLAHRLAHLQLDKGTKAFLPSNLEVTSIDVGNPAFNVIPAEASTRFNVRFNDIWTVETLTRFLRAELEAAAEGEAFDFTIAGRPSESFLTQSETLIAPVRAAVRDVTGIEPELSTGGGTSDARFFRDVCPVVELGLVGDTMHQVDERVPVADVETLTVIYRAFLDRFYAQSDDA